MERLPPHVWPGNELYAYAVERFDRDSDQQRIHIEDLAQVRDFYPDGKYRGNYETVASLIYRGHDVKGLREFARRLAFIVLISNGDAHLKNWSLIYRDPRIATLAPAYDLVATAPYRQDGTEDLGLRFSGSKRFDLVNLATFARLETRLGIPEAGLIEVVTDTVTRVRAAWPEHAEALRPNGELRKAIDQSIAKHSVTLLKAR